MKDRAKKNGIIETKGKRYDVTVVTLAFFVISFLGWAYETALMYLWHGRYFDRGFLTLPFCPIYGAPVCLLYLLLGTPQAGKFASFFEGRFGQKTGAFWVFLRYVLYFLLSAAFATFAELSVGLLFEGVGVSLWSYSDQPLNFRGHICLHVSLLWGVLLTVFMRFIMPSLLRLLAKIPKKFRGILCLLLLTATLVDFFWNIAALVRPY